MVPSPGAIENHEFEALTKIGPVARIDFGERPAQFARADPQQTLKPEPPWAKTVSIGTGNYPSPEMCNDSSRYLRMRTTCKGSVLRPSVYGRARYPAFIFTEASLRMDVLVVCRRRLAVSWICAAADSRSSLSLQ